MEDLDVWCWATYPIYLEKVRAQADGDSRVNAHSLLKDNNLFEHIHDMQCQSRRLENIKLDKRSKTPYMALGKFRSAKMHSSVSYRL